VKNEALEQSLGLERWHLSWLMLLQVAVSLLPGSGTCILLFSQGLGSRGLGSMRIVDKIKKGCPGGHP